MHTQHEYKPHELLATADACQAGAEAILNQIDLDFGNQTSDTDSVALGMEQARILCQLRLDTLLARYTGAAIFSNLKKGNNE